MIILQNIFAFIVIVGLIVFIHELGHFLAARICKVKVEAFSIGFGPEVFGFNDRYKTRWKICYLPLGGYVKMFGDKSAASTPDNELLKKLTPKEKAQSLVFQNVYRRIFIVAAGPAMNFIFAILLFTILFKISGLNTISPVAAEVVKDGAAFEAGIKAGDKIITIDQNAIKDFDDVVAIVSTNADQKLKFKIESGGEIKELTVTPKSKVRKNIFGEEVKSGMIGVLFAPSTTTKLNLFSAFYHANIETVKMTGMIYKALGELIIGNQNLDELGGPVKIAVYSGKTMHLGISAVLWFMALISINLGAINLLPIPILDGGHLFFYLAELIRRKPLSLKIQQWGFQIGFVLLVGLMIFTTVNDIKHLIQ